MLARAYRSLCAVSAVLVLAQAPCFAQPPPPPPPDDGPILQVAPSVPFYESGLAPNSWDRFWSSLADTPPLRHGYGDPVPLSPVYRVTWFPEAAVQGQQTHLSSVRQDFSVTCPLWKDECSFLGLTTTVRNEIFNTHAVIPGTTQVFPDELWDVRFGLTYKYQFANGWSAGGTVSFGSASDRPFGSASELTASVMAFLRIPVGEHNAWLFSLMYSPTGELNFPVPGVAFYWQPSDTFNATIGVPFKLWWRPVENLTLEASYMPLTTVKGKVSYRLWGGISVYAAYDMGNESYYLYHREDSLDRFFYFDERVTGGVKLEFGRQAVLDLSSGFAFDRHYFEAHTSTDSHNRRIDVSDGAFLSLMFEWRF